MNKHQNQALSGMIELLKDRYFINPPNNTNTLYGMIGKFMSEEMAYEIIYGKTPTSIIGKMKEMEKENVNR